MLEIFIPTRARPDHQKTAELLEAAEIEYTLVRTYEDEDNYPTPEFGSEWWIDVKGIRDKRQVILDYCKENNVGKVVMLDDDLKIYRRRNEKQFTKCDIGDLRQFFTAIDGHLNAAAHVGVTEYFMSQHTPRGFIANKRSLRILGYNTKLFPDPWPTFRREIGEEHDFNLQLLTQGRGNRILTEWAQGDFGRPGGGCDIWRTEQQELLEAEAAANAWPGICRVHKGVKLRVNWKKAAKIGGLE